MEAETCPRCSGREFVMVASIAKMETVTGPDGKPRLEASVVLPIAAPCTCIELRAAMGVKP